MAIVALGDNEQTSREAWAENHLGDRTSLELVGEQEKLVPAAVRLGRTTRADADASAAFDSVYDRFKEHYPAMQPLFRTS